TALLWCTIVRTTVDEVSRSANRVVEDALDERLVFDACLLRGGGEIVATRERRVWIHFDDDDVPLLRERHVEAAEATDLEDAIGLARGARELVGGTLGERGGGAVPDLPLLAIRVVELRLRRREVRCRLVLLGHAEERFAWWERDRARITED